MNRAAVAGDPALAHLIEESQSSFIATPSFFAPAQSLWRCDDTTHSGIMLPWRPAMRENASSSACSRIVFETPGTAGVGGNSPSAASALGQRHHFFSGGISKRAGVGQLPLTQRPSASLDAARRPQAAPRSIPAISDPLAGRTTDCPYGCHAAAVWPISVPTAE